MLFGRRRFVHRFTKAMELVALQYPRRGYHSITILNVRHRVREGESFSKALSHYNKVFDQGYQDTIAWADGSSAKLLVALRLLSNNLTQRKNSPPRITLSTEYSVAENKITTSRN